ncbi:SWPV1-056 [Shearwaterpox virus]|uniref:SWPV1-056 n=1 Tax=Shearwaterpox virus TaxID=1974596 RepID=A0A1V0S7S0_CNPV|nr:SWPV1-056 [Shearwaterpox virus]
MFVIILLVLTLHKSISENLISPRIRTSIKDYDDIKYFNFTTLYYDVVTYPEKSSTLVGVTNKVHIFNFTDNTNNSVDFMPENEKPSDNKDANNYITFIGTYQNKTMVCGTNANSPKCWFLIGLNKTTGPSGLGLAPYKFNPSNDDIVIIDGEDVYSTIPKYGHLKKKFRRISGSNQLYTSDSVLKDPKFLKILSLKESSPINDTIYVFFLERGYSKVFRVCKSDVGGQGSLSSSKWSTLLKSVLICKDSNDRQFNKLIEVFEEMSGNNTYFYGLFMNEWNFSAVCVFNFKNIQHNFNTSPLEGFSGKMPTTRPGTCLKTSTPSDTFKIIDEYPETQMHVRGKMLFESIYPYTHLIVNSTTIFHHKKLYSVIILYLSTEDGKIHKVIVYRDGAICVMELTLKDYYSPVLSMFIDNNDDKLYVSYNDTIMQLPSALCNHYGKTCDSCVMSRDPHCGWKNKKCVYGDGKKILQHSLLNVSSNICSSSKVKHEYLNRTVLLSPSSYHILVCFTVSYQASYKWVKDNSTIKTCTVGSDECSHMVPRVDNRFGEYMCIEEEGWSSVVSIVDNIKVTLDS